MTTPQPAPELHLTRVIKAKREAVFAAWTQPDLLRRWFTPSNNTVAAATLDARAGGRYRIAMTGPGCGGADQVAVSGTYREVVANQRLQFTWKAEHGAGGESLVTVEFRDVEGGTEVSITHRGAAGEAERANFKAGWTDVLGALDAYAGGADFARTVEIAAPRERVYALLATLAGASRWWTTKVTGSAAAGGELRFDYGKGMYARMRIERAEAPSLVVWDCVECTPLPDWVGTRISFALEARGGDRALLSFRHVGLTPQLECFDTCQRGWDRFLPSLVAEAERGAGQPMQVA